MSRAPWIFSGDPSVIVTPQVVADVELAHAIAALINPRVTKAGAGLEGGRLADECGREGHVPLPACAVRNTPPEQAPGSSRSPLLSA
jgi:hypothetical protein